MRQRLRRPARPQRQLQQLGRALQAQPQAAHLHQQVHGAHRDELGDVLRPVEEPLDVRKNQISTHEIYFNGSFDENIFPLSF